MRLPDGSHLTYCTNIHAGESWAAIQAGLENYITSLKAKLAPDVPFGLGLRIGAQAAEELIQGEELQRLKTWLQANGLYVFTLNGFPYGDFHHTRVKDRVHYPDWTTIDRLEYTRNLIQILAYLLPEGMEGSISTSPLSYRHWHRPLAQEEVKRKSTHHLLTLIGELAMLEEQTGTYIHLDIEPEPDGLLENSTELIQFFDQWLFGKGAHTPGRAAISRYCCVCYDVCHFAVEFESHGKAMDHLTANGIKIGKVQVSSALKTMISGRDRDSEARVAALNAFEESTYLHQVVIERSNGTLEKFQDLDQAIKSWRQKPRPGQWRVHFHVPIFIKDYGVLSSTQADILRVFKELKKRNVKTHLEVETYTWEVLPLGLQVDLTTSITRELNWVKEHYATNGST